MASIHDPNTANINEPVIGVIKVKVDAIDTPDILSEAIDVLDSESRHLQGLLAAQILVSVDNKTVVILTEWSDRHAWSQSRYDVRVGKMMELCHAKSTTMEFEIYTRRGQFPRMSRA